MSNPGFDLSDGVDPATPLFFLSYAHSRFRNPDRNRRFRQFFDDLQENVAELVSRPAGSDPGYMDRSIPGGAPWSAELLRIIGTCQVFVALLSPPYLDSPWCAREWHAFVQRRVVSHPQGKVSDQTAIISVMWTPLRDEEIPAAVSRVQRFLPRPVANADIAAQYEGEGLLGLLQLDNDAYKAVVWRIAQRIAEINYNFRVEPGQFQYSELRDTFKEPGA
jgi:TIR domain-containing protein